MIICISVPISVLTQKGHIRNIKNDIGMDGDTYDHSLYNCTIGSILLHSFLLIYHPYPPSFHEMVFTLVYNSLLAKANVEPLVTTERTFMLYYTALMSMLSIFGEREQAV